MKRKIKKYIISMFLIGLSSTTTLSLVSCSASSFSQAFPEISLKLNAGSTNTFLKGYSFIPTPNNPEFKNAGSPINKEEKHEPFFEYWINLLGPMYSMAMPSVTLDSATKDSKNLSVNAVTRDPSFNWVISNSWISGSGIYVDESLRFKTSPYEMRATINGDIPKFEHDKTPITASNLKTSVTMNGLEFDFKYHNINNGQSNTTAKNQLTNFFGDKLPEPIKDFYTVSFNLFSEITYEVLNISDEKPVTPGVNFDNTKMKVKVTNEYWIGEKTTGTKITPGEVILEFNDWIKNTAAIKDTHKNFIKSIIGKSTTPTLFKNNKL